MDILKTVRKNKTNYVIIFTTVILMLIAAVPVSAETLLSEGTGEFNYSTGSNGQVYREYIQFGNNISVNGSVTTLRFVIAPDANLTNCTSFYIRFWRLNSTTGNYTCIGSTPDLKSQLSLNLTNITLSTSIPVQAGDLYGYAFSSSGGYLVRIPYVNTTGFGVKYTSSSSTVYSVGSSVNFSDISIITDYGSRLWKVDAYGTVGSSGSLISVSSISPNSNGYIVKIGEPVRIALGDTYSNLSVSVDGSLYNTLTNTDHADVTFSEGSHNVSFVSGNDTGHCYIHAYNDIAQVSPYLGNHSTVTPTLGKSGINIQIGNQQRIRQTGEIRYIGAYIQNTATLSHFSFQIWRRNATSGNYTLIADTGNLTVDGDGYNLIPLTGISVQEGDFYGFSMHNSQFTYSADTSATGTSL